MTPPDEAPPDPPSAVAPPPAVAAFDASTRRAWRRYGVVLGLVVVLALGWFVITVARGEISHATLSTAAAAPAPVPAGPLGPSLTVAWQSADATASGAPFYGGTVVTYSQHAVRGRDALTGAVRWSFTRSDRVVCAAVQESGKTMALFSAKGDCDQLTMLSTDTGERLGERTLFDDGHLIKGIPGVIASPDALTLTTEALVRTIRFSDGLNGWTYVAPAGCQNLRVVRGSAGVLISQHCGDGDYLLLRDLNAADTTDPKDNPVIWRIRTRGVVPLAADTFVAALDPGDRQLTRYSEKTGAPLGRTPLTPTPSPLRAVLQSADPAGELIWIGDTTYSTDAAGTSQTWSIPASTLPTFSGPRTGRGDVDTSTLAMPVRAGIAELDRATGATTRTFAVSTPPADSVIVRLGTGFLVAADSTTVYQ